MKTMISAYVKRKLAKGVLFGTLAVVVALQASCNSDDLNGDSYYTFKGEMVSDDLRNRPQFSMFKTIVERAGLMDQMSAYGTYSCFAPTNEAIQLYLDSLVIKGIIPEANWNSFPDEETLDSIRTVVVLNSILDGTKLEKTYITA
jgi:hypothetical protein